MTESRFCQHANPLSPFLLPSLTFGGNIIKQGDLFIEALALVSLHRVSAAYGGL